MQLKLVEMQALVIHARGNSCSRKFILVAIQLVEIYARGNSDMGNQILVIQSRETNVKVRSQEKQFRILDFAILHFDFFLFFLSLSLRLYCTSSQTHKATAHHTQ